MEDVPRLPDQYLEKAREMADRHRIKSKCKSCYDRGYQGINQLNMLVTCHKCVDGDALMEEWRALIRDTPELSEMYGDYFEEEEEEEEEEEAPEETGSQSMAQLRALEGKRPRRPFPP